MWNAELDEAHIGIKIAGRNINNLRYADDTTLMAESEEELKSLFMKLKEKSEKVGLKLNIQKTKIMASSPITSWQLDGQTMETATDFIFLGSKITANGDCIHEIMRFAPWKKSCNKPRQRIRTHRHHFADKVKLHIVIAMVFPIIMYRCESWTIKKAEHRRIDAFELWCWRRLFRVSWTARRSNQSIRNETNPEYLLEGLMLKLQHFGHLIQRTNSLEKTLMLEKSEGRRRRGWQRMRWLDGITSSIDMSLSKFWEIVKDREAFPCCSPWGCKESDVTQWLNNNNKILLKWCNENVFDYPTEIQ